MQNVFDDKRIYFAWCFWELVLVKCLEECLALRVSNKPKYGGWMWEMTIEYPHHLGSCPWSLPLVRLKHPWINPIGLWSSPCCWLVMSAKLKLWPLDSPLVSWSHSALLVPLLSPVTVQHKLPVSEAGALLIWKLLQHLSFFPIA